jgi:hypothetical protein
MAGRRSEGAWWHAITRSERFNRAEWMLLGVSATALLGAVVMLSRVVL